MILKPTAGQIKTLQFLKLYNFDILESLKGSQIFLQTMVAIKCWESAFGTSDLAVYYNNFGGIKGRPKYSTGKTAKGWAIFPSPRASFDSFVEFTQTLRTGYGANSKLRYQQALDAKTPEDQVYWLVYNFYCHTPTNLSNDARAKFYLGKIQSFINIMTDRNIGGKVGQGNITALQQNIYNTPI